VDGDEACEGRRRKRREQTPETLRAPCSTTLPATLRSPAAAGSEHGLLTVADIAGEGPAGDRIASEEIPTMRACLIVLSTLLAATVVNGREVERVLTPEIVREALTVGDISRSYLLVSERTVVGLISTPFFRIAQSSEWARRRYQRFSEADVTPDMRADELRVHVPPLRPFTDARILDVEAIVIAPIGSESLDAVIHPLRTEEFTEEYRNLLGASLEGKGMMASFPLDLLSEKYELRIVYDGPYYCGPRRRGKHTDCRIPFTERALRKIR
jgi:hypothetical protein